MILILRKLHGRFRGGFVIFSTKLLSQRYPKKNSSLFDQDKSLKKLSSKNLQLFDQDKSGTFEAAEIKHVLGTLGEGVGLDFQIFNGEMVALVLD